MVKRVLASIFAWMVAVAPLSAAADGGIQWYGTWRAGLAEAARTGRPILLVSAAPHCHNISGIW